MRDVLHLVLAVLADARDQELLGHGPRLGVGHQVLADLGVDVEAGPARVVDVLGVRDAVGELVVLVGMQEHAHRGDEVIDAIELALLVGAEVPQAGEHLLHGGREVTLVGAVGERVVEPGAVEAGQVLVVGARARADRAIGAEARGEVGLHCADGVAERRGHRGLLDGLAQLREGVLADGGVVGEPGCGDHRTGRVVEPELGHEPLVERERQRAAVGHDRGRQHAAQLGDVGGLGAERGRVGEAERGERRGLGARQIARRHLRGRRTLRLEVSRDVLGRGRLDVDAVSGDLEPHDAIAERHELGARGRAGEICVRRVVLLGLQVDVGQRRLRRGGHDAGDVGQLARGLLEHHHVAHGRGATRRRAVLDPQRAEADAEVHRRERDAGEQLAGDHHPHSGVGERRALLVEATLLALARRVVRDVAGRERQRRGDELVRERDVRGGDRVGRPELDGVQPEWRVGRMGGVVQDGASQVGAVVAEVRDRVPRLELVGHAERGLREVEVIAEALGLDQVQRRGRAVDAGDQELHRAQLRRAGDVVAHRERVECRHRERPLGAMGRFDRRRRRRIDRRRIDRRRFTRLLRRRRLRRLLRDERRCSPRDHGQRRHLDDRTPPVRRQCLQDLVSSTRHGASLARKTVERLGQQR